MNSLRRTTVISGLLVGCLGGAVIWSVGLAWLLTGVAFGGLYGLIFALLVGRRAAGPGAGLLWDLGYTLLIWLAGPAGLFPLLGGADGAPGMGMLDTVRAHFPELVAYLLCFGLPLGLKIGILGSLRSPERSPSRCGRGSACRGRWWSGGRRVSWGDGPSAGGRRRSTSSRSSRTWPAPTRPQ